MKQGVIETIKQCFLGILLVFALGFLSSCEEEGAEYINELDVVVTRYDKDFDFTNIKTYLMPDSVVHVPQMRFLTASDSVFDRAALDRIASNMESLGFVRLDEDLNEGEEPDVVVTLTMVDRDYYGVYGWGFGPWYDYWGWYSWDYWGYGWIGPEWYPYYPIYWGGYSYSTGTLVVDMMLPQEEGENNRIPVVWNGIFNGIYSYGIGERMLEGIDQMFEQSSYLSQN